MNTDRALICGICLLYHVDGGSALLRSYAKWFHSYMYMKMPVYILNLRHTENNGKTPYGHLTSLENLPITVAVAARPK